MIVENRNSAGEEILLEDIVRDKITGFEGKAVGITQWTTMCARVSVQPMMTEEMRTKGEKIPASYDFDVLNLELLQKGPRHAAEPARELVGAGKGGPPTLSARR